MLCNKEVLNKFKRLLALSASKAITFTTVLFFNITLKHFKSLQKKTYHILLHFPPVSLENIPNAYLEPYQKSIIGSSYSEGLLEKDVLNYAANLQKNTHVEK